MEKIEITIDESASVRKFTDGGCMEFSDKLAMTTRIQVTRSELKI